MQHVYTDSRISVVQHQSVSSFEMTPQSLSVLITPTTTGSNPTAERVTSTAWSPSERPSFTPVTTTVCGVSQFNAVNVNSEADTTASDRSEDTTETTTSPAGSDPRANVNESEEPDSDITVELSDSTNDPNPTAQAGTTTSTSSSTGSWTGSSGQPSPFEPDKDNPAN